MCTYLQVYISASFRIYRKSTHHDRPRDVETLGAVHSARRLWNFLI